MYSVLAGGIRCHTLGRHQRIDASTIDDRSLLLHASHLSGVGSLGQHRPVEATDSDVSTYASGLGPCAFITRSSCFVHRNIPVELTDMHVWKLSNDVSVTSVVGPMIPAKFLRISSASDPFFFQVSEEFWERTLHSLISRTLGRLDQRRALRPPPL